MRIKKLLACFGVTLALYAGCVPTEETPDPEPVPIRPATPASGGVYTASEPAWPLYEITFTGSDSSEEKRIPVEDLAGHSVYLVKINRGSTSVSANRTGHAYTTSRTANIRTAALPDIAPYSRAALAGGAPVRRDHLEAQLYNSNPRRYAQGRSPARAPAAPSGTPAVEGEQRQFHVQNAQGGWIQIPATVRAQSTYANVWIADERFDDGSSSQTDNLITAAQAAAMAAKFDSIYGYETALFGFEYGGKTDGIYTGQPSGGVDRDLRVQILVYDIDYDAAVDKKSFVVGYFWAKDLENGAHSNQAEMFYIDSEATDKNPELAYSTLVHEFQHMINYNRKFILSNEMRASSTWFDEMLSMLAEDMISPLIGINANNSAHPIKGRIPAFIGYYDRGGITGWNTAEPLISYAVSYGFGAYLARNYGGPSLIKAIMDANEVDIAAINNALNNTPGGISGSSPFQDALQRYGEALIFSGGFMPSGANSFDKDKAGNADTSNTYTFKGFDIWDTANPATGYPGPTVWSLDWQFPMPAYSIIVQSLADWQGVQGNLNITVTKPHNPANVKLYLMVR